MTEWEDSLNAQILLQVAERFPGGICAWTTEEEQLYNCWFSQRIQKDLLYISSSKTSNSTKKLKTHSSTILPFLCISSLSHFLLLSILSPFFPLCLESLPFSSSHSFIFSYISNSSWCVCVVGGSAGSWKTMNSCIREVKYQTLIQIFTCLTILGKLFFIFIFQTWDW